MTATTLIDAYVEMNRRADTLAAANRESAGDNMPIIEARVDSDDLRDHVTLTQTERIARFGRKTNVHLVIVGQPGSVPTLHFFGGSAVLREAAFRCDWVDVEAVR